MIQHPFPPLFGPDSDTLILGSFPSVKSREAMFFYGHPQNRFWRVLAALYGESVPQTVNEKRRSSFRTAWRSGTPSPPVRSPVLPTRPSGMRLPPIFLLF